jgi:UDP-3-O-[3-hydroxymyristoyl] glucosamine N-acyltransferase
VTTLGALAEAIGGSLEGDPDIPIHGVRSPEAAGPSDIAVLLDRRAPKEPLRAGALVVGGGTRPPAPHPPLVVVANPRRAFAVLLSVFHPPRAKEPGVQPGAHVSPRASVDPTAHVAAGATVEAGAVLEARVEVHAGAYVGEGVVVGEESVLFPNAVLYEGTRVGRRVRIHAGAVVGSDGFGYERDEKGRQMKVPQAGGVVLGDDVEIGANAAIDRATLETTVIGAGTKIDNLVQIGHNTQIGEHCCLVGQSGVSGSVTIGDFAVAQCGVPGDLDAGVGLGTPAMLATTARRVFPAVARLPETVKRVKELEERCARLEARLESLLAEARERR